MHVGFIYNIATDDLLRERPAMTLSDCDSVDTIQAITAALEAGGHTVTGLNADRQLPARLVESQFDIVFNIATGVYGETRQAHVPAMLDYLRIPHTGAGVFAEAICHHKPPTKMILSAYGVPTAPFQLMRNAADPLKPELHFPLIVKLPSEGGSLGLSYDSIVNDEAALRDRVASLLADYPTLYPEQYQGAVLVETYIDGREFTVSVLGNDPPRALPVAELLFFGTKPIRLDEPDVPTFEDFKRVVGQDVPFVAMESRSLAPADISAEVAAHIEQIAIAAYQAIGCRDWARVDLRMDTVGTVYVLEVNLEPGIAPDYVMMKSAAAAGWSYNELINNILNHAIARYPHLKS